MSGAAAADAGVTTPLRRDRDRRRDRRRLPGAPAPVARRRRPRVLGVLAVVLAVAGALLATVARPAQEVSAAVVSAGTAPLLVTDAGLLERLGGRVTVRATGPGPVLVAAGRADDVAAWVDGAATTAVTGLTDDGAFSAISTPGDEQVPDPSGSDLWTAQASGTGSAELTVDPAAAPTRVLVASDGTAPAPVQVELRWTERPVPVVAWVLLAAGALGLVATAAGRRRRREAVVVTLPPTGPAAGPAAGPHRAGATSSTAPLLVDGDGDGDGQPAPVLSVRPRGRERRSTR